VPVAARLTPALARRVAALLRAPDGWGHAAIAPWLAPEVEAAARAAREAIASTDDPAAALRDLEQALATDDAPRAPDGPVGLARRARGAHVVEPDATIDPDLGATLTRAAERRVGDALRARIIDDGDDTA
jgi:hypothetical protein